LTIFLSKYTPLPIKLTATITEILLNAELNTINQTIRRLQKMEQTFNKGVDSDDSRIDHEKYTVHLPGKCPQNNIIFMSFLNGI
jgi:hypothetical protein